MKSERLAISLEYMRFTTEADGEEFTEELEQKFSDIMEGDLSADKAVADYIRSEGLDTSSDDPKLDDQSRYPGTRQMAEMIYHRYRCLSCARTFGGKIPLRYPHTRIPDRTARKHSINMPILPCTLP